MDYYKINCALGAIFLLINLFIGLWAGRGISNIKDYILANKKFGVGALVITYLATEVGDDTIFRSPFEFFSYGIGYLLVTGGAIITFFLRAYLIAPIMYRFKDCMTLSDIMQQLYGPNAKIFTGIISSVYSLIVAGFQIYCMGVIFEKFLGINSQIGMIFSGAILILYSAFGGIRAVTATDIFQFVMAVGTLLFIAAVAVNKIGGIEVLFNSIPNEKFLITKTPRFPYYISIFIMVFVFFLELCEPCRVQRVLMSNNSTNLKKTFLALGFSEIIITLVVLLLSFSAIVLCPDANPNEVIITLCQKILPNSVQGVLAIGFLAIFLSTGDSYLHSAGVSLSYDFISPILAKFKKNIHEVRWAQICTVFLGILSILFALFEGYTIRLDYIFASLSLFVVSPLLFGLFGFISKPSTYFGSCIIALLAFIGFKFTNSLIEEFIMPISMLSGTVGFFILHVISNQKIIIAENLYNKKYSKSRYNEFCVQIKHILTGSFNLVQFCQKKVEEYSVSYTLFGTLYTIMLVLPYFFWSNESYITHENLVLYLRLIGVIMCAILMAEGRIPQIFRKYLSIFSYLTMTYCLPFLSIVMLLITNGATEYLINIALSIMFLMVLVDIPSAIGIGLVGTIVAILFYKFFIKTDGSSYEFSFNTVYLLVYQIIFGTIIGLLFARKKQLKTKKLEETVDSATEQYELTAKKLNDKEFGPLRIAQSIGKNNFGLLSTIARIRKAMQNEEEYLAEEYLDVLESEILYIANNESFLKLDAKEITLEELRSYLESICAAKFHKTIEITLNTKAASIVCDKLAISRIILQAVEDSKEDLKLFGKNFDTADIIIEISDTKLHYQLSYLKEYSKIINAIRFTISSTNTLDTSSFKQEYKRELVDAYSIPAHTEDTTTERVAAEKYLTAHYGVYENLNSREEVIKVCVIPQDIYAIRPKGLDIHKTVNNRNVIPFWPKALDQELLLKKEIELKAPRIKWENIQKALSFSRFYYDQKHLNSSGEPYHIHTIAVARIILEIITNYIPHLKYPTKVKEVFTNDSHVRIIRDIDNPLIKVYNDITSRQESIIIATLLHYTLEEAANNPPFIEGMFNYEVFTYIVGITKLNYNEIASKKLASMVRQEITEENWLGTLTYHEAIPFCIKVADRLQTLYSIDGDRNESNRRKLARETLDFFITPTENLGFHSIAKDFTNASNHILKHGKIEGFKFESGVLDFLDKNH